MITKRIVQLLASILIGLFAVGGFLGIAHRARASMITKAENPLWSETQPFTQTLQTQYFPMTMKNYPSFNMFGVESLYFTDQWAIVLTYTKQLPAGWIRLNGRISWRSLQPDEGGPILWDQLAGFEQELRILKAANIAPIVIVDDYPRWATEMPNSCGKLLDSKLGNFAVFAAELVNRYKIPEFDVHNWELGNEPDVDPSLVAPDNAFGCWGDINDPYYGGEAYGRMLIQVGAAIKAADPWAQVWMGGLLLATPLTTDPNLGHPEKFLEGVLRSGAAPYFDVVPYHWYPSYGWETVRDFDIKPLTWAAWGGGTVGKARYLRQVMQAYSVSKRVSLNETAFGCPNDQSYYTWCVSPSDAFFDLQANYIVRAATRAYNENISNFIWYTINGPGWRWGGLLNGNQSPKPVYQAYAYMIEKYKNSRPMGPISYTVGVEAYAFDRGSDHLNILWAIDNQTITVTVPITEWIGAYGRNGEVITPTEVISNYLVPIGFSPVYLILRP